MGMAPPQLGVREGCLTGAVMFLLELTNYKLWECLYGPGWAWRLD